jgi:hypothetical protein
MSVPEEPDHAGVKSPPSTKHSFALKEKVSKSLADRFKMNFEAV